MMRYRRYPIGGSLPDYRLDPPDPPRECPCEESGECPDPHHTGRVFLDEDGDTVCNCPCHEEPEPPDYPEWDEEDSPRW